MAFRAFAIALLIFLLGGTAWPQAVVLRPGDVLPRLKEASADAFYINGPQVHGLTDDMAETRYPLGGSAKYVLALVTLRLVDKGVIDLDEPVAKAVPDLLDFNPFEVAVTPWHLLTETAGFASPQPDLPPGASTAPLRYFMIKMRGAGQIAVDDPIGWQLLKAFLEQRTGQPLPDLLAQEIYEPLGLGPEAFRPAAPVPWHVPLSDHTASGATVARLLQILARNRQANGEAYLSPDAYGWLTTRPLWQMHPMGPKRLAGLAWQRFGVHAALAIPSSGFETISALALPDAGLVFIDLDKMAHVKIQQAFEALVADHLPPNLNEAALRDQAAQLLPPEETGFRFGCADIPPGLRQRLAHAATCNLGVRAGEGGTLRLQAHNYDAISIAAATNTAPFFYETGRTSQPLILSPYRAGGYAVWGGRTFVRVDFLGALQIYVQPYVPLMVILLLSCALHIRSNTSVQWRRFAVMGTVGTLLVAFGLYADWFWWPSVLYEWQQPWLITLWRVGLNIGLMLVLSLPMFAASFIQRQNMPKSGLALLFAGPHLGLIALAAIALFLTTVIWGVAGTFSPY